MLYLIRSKPSSYQFILVGNISDCCHLIAAFSDVLIQHHAVQHGRNRIDIIIAGKRQNAQGILIGFICLCLGGMAHRLCRQKPA